MKESTTTVINFDKRRYLQLRDKHKTVINLNKIDLVKPFNDLGIELCIGGLGWYVDYGSDTTRDNDLQLIRKIIVDDISG